MPVSPQSSSGDGSTDGFRGDSLESIYEEFESAWARDPYPDFRRYLELAEGASQTTLFTELIQIDMERRWRAEGTVPDNDPLPSRPLVQDYLSAFPECGGVEDISIDSLVAEFRIRHLWGDEPDIHEFVGQFPARRDELLQACEEVALNASMQATQDSLCSSNSGSTIDEVVPGKAAAGTEKSPEISYLSLSEGMQISHYTLRRQIGKGGFGVVFEAANLDRPYQQCAVKLIRPDRVARPKLAERFKQEITALTGLSHPNIACATDHGEWEGVVFLVLEYVQGLSVDGLVQRKSGLLIADACELVRQAAIGLQHIHEKQRTHRDIKPSNLMVTTDGTVKILDLGLARLTDIEDHEERLTSLGDVMGTPEYMAPEQWQDFSKVDIRGDIYSLGCTLYCLLAGEHPFASSTHHDPVALMRAHSESPIPNVAGKRGDVPEAVRELIADRMAKRPEDRPAEPQTVADRLVPFVAESQLAALSESSNEPVPAAAADQTIVEPTERASDNPSNDETFVEPKLPTRGTVTEVAPTEISSLSGVAADETAEATMVEPAVTPQTTAPNSGTPLRPEAANAGETLIESAEATKVPTFEETLIQHADNLNSKLAEQSIKPTGSTRISGSQQSGSISSMSRSYSTSGSVVLTPRQLTYGKVTGIDNAEYEIGAKLGEGGMGAVYRARQGSVDRGVALKMVKKNQGPANAQDMFLAEAVVTGALEHPNIVPIYDLGVNTDDELFYAMKEVQGHAWTDSIDTASLEENLEVIGKVSDAIAFSHEKGIVHRDLKPDNIMIGQFGEVVVMDWGLALPTNKFEKPGLPFTQGLAGTPSYMAPEMADLSLTPIGPAADIYLLGALLFRAVTKRAPHTGKHAYAALQAAAVNTIQWPDDQEAGHDEELLDIARKAMATRPEDRYETATEFKHALRDYRSHSESRRLTDSAIDELKNAEASSSYRSFERTVAALEEAIKLWAENVRASETLETARLRYAHVAYQKGDLDLAEGQLDQHVDAHRELLTSIQQTRLEREAQAKRLRRMKQTAATMAAVVFLTVSVSVVLINSARNKEKTAKEKEAVAKIEAVQRFRESQAAIAELSGLADSLRDYPLAQAERQKLLQAVTSYYDRQTSEQSDVPELRRDQLQSLLRLGEVQNQLAEYANAIKTWDRAITMAGDLQSMNDADYSAIVLGAKALAGRAQSESSMGNLAAARKSNEKAIDEMSSAHSKDLGGPPTVEIASLKMQQALVEKADGNYDRALSLVKSAITSLRSFAETGTNDYVLKELAVAHSIQSQIHELAGEFVSAAGSTQNAIERWQTLTKEKPNSVVYADGLATSQIDSANIRRAAGDDPLGDYEKAVATFQRLVELRPGIPRYRFNLASALSGMGWTQNRLLKTEAAQETAVQAVNTLLFLSRRYPEDPSFPLGEVSVRLMLAEILRDRGELDFAVEILEQASEALSREDISPDLPQSRERFGELFLLYGQVQSALGDSQLAQDSLLQSAEVLSELAESKAGLPRHHDGTAWAFYHLSVELAEAQDDDGARRAVEEAIRLRSQLPERANWLDSFAWLLLHSPSESLRDAARAESLSATAAKLAIDNPRFLRTRALAELRSEKHEQAAETLSKADALAGEDHPEHQFLAAIVAFRQSRPQDATELFLKAAAGMDAAAPANPRLKTIRDEAAAVTGVAVPVRQDGAADATLPTN
jgi:serine/threonine protein kinase